MLFILSPKICSSETDTLMVHNTLMHTCQKLSRSICLFFAFTWEIGVFEGFLTSFLKFVRTKVGRCHSNELTSFYSKTNCFFFFQLHKYTFVARCPFSNGGIWKDDDDDDDLVHGHLWTGAGNELNGQPEVNKWNREGKTIHPWTSHRRHAV